MTEIVDSKQEINKKKKNLGKKKNEKTTGNEKTKIEHAKIWNQNVLATLANLILYENYAKDRFWLLFIM